MVVFVVECVSDFFDGLFVVVAAAFSFLDNVAFSLPDSVCSSTFLD